MTPESIAPEIEALLSGGDDASIVDRLLSLPVPTEGDALDQWNRAVGRRLETVLARHMRAQIADDAELDAA